MRYMEGYPVMGRVETQFFDTTVTVTERIETVNADNAVRVLSARLAANGFKTDTGSAKPADQGGLEDYEVEVQRTVTTTVTVRAKNAPSAALQVNQISFPLPPVDEWESLKGWEYTVREKGGDKIMYEGDAQELT